MKRTILLLTFRRFPEKVALADFRKINRNNSMEIFQTKVKASQKLLRQEERMDFLVVSGFQKFKEGNGS